MIPIPPQALKFGAYGLIVSAAYIGGCVRGSQTANEKYLRFKADVEAVGKASQRDADIKAAKDKEKAHASDLSYAKALTVLGADIERLHKRTSTNSLPAPPADTKCPEGWACFDRAIIQSALQRLDEELSGIAEEGDQVRLRLEYAIKWANSK